MAILIVQTMMIWLIMMIILILLMMMMMMILINTEKLGILEHYLKIFIEIITNQ